MKSNRWLTSAGYLLAAYLILVPLTETALAVVPVGLGDPTWRFGAVGLFSRALMTPLLGVMIALAIALALAHRRAMQTLSGLCALGGVVLLVALPFFLLDGARMRDVLPVEDQGSVGIVVASASLKLLLATLVCAEVGPLLKRRRTPKSEDAAKGAQPGMA